MMAPMARRKLPVHQGHLCFVFKKINLTLIVCFLKTKNVLLVAKICVFKGTATPVAPLKAWKFLSPCSGSQNSS